MLSLHFTGGNIYIMLPCDACCDEIRLYLLLRRICLCSFGAQTIVVLAVQQVLHWASTGLTSWQLQIGPSALLASAFVSYFKDIPALQRFKIVGIPATDKVLIESPFAQLQPRPCPNILLHCPYLEVPVAGKLSGHVCPGCISSAGALTRLTLRTSIYKEHNVKRGKE